MGVQNNSAQAVDAITVSGPSGSGIFGFDNDGLCTFVKVPCGATGYEGPGTSFQIDPSTGDRGEVDFGNSGLAPNSPAYFSLEGALDAASLTARRGHLGDRYVALGDSYASGEGASSFDFSTNIPGVNMCHRATNGWVQKVAKAANLGAPDFAACSGALIDDLYAPSLINGNDAPVAGNVREKAQLDHLNTVGPGASTPPKLVTLSLGGNNIGFPDVLADCIVGPPGTPGKPDCAGRDARRKGHGTTVQDAIGWLTGTGRPAGCHDLPGIAQLTGRPEQICGSAPPLHQVYEDILSRMAPGGKLLVLGYPQLFTQTPHSQLFGGPSVACRVATVNLPGTLHLDVSSGDVVWLNRNALKLDSTINSEVNLASYWATTKKISATVQYVSVDSSFKDHRLCDQAPWINPLILHFPDPTIFGKPEVDHLSFHPNDSGQVAQGVVMVAKLP
ncbi:MAG: SGNH/GDSL hydrolase family protein [Actinomycetota bacterium]|nr:SGNH/GDSL hydrolase family protein [Actinomycetota bacterium]